VGLPSAISHPAPDVTTALRRRETRTTCGLYRGEQRAEVDWASQRREKEIDRGPYGGLVWSGGGEPDRLRGPGLASRTVESRVLQGLDRTRSVDHRREGDSRAGWANLLGWDGDLAANGWGMSRARFPPVSVLWWKCMATTNRSRARGKDINPTHLHDTLIF
jgi:hypothetical protein